MFSREQSRSHQPHCIFKASHRCRGQDTPLHPCTLCCQMETRPFPSKQWLWDMHLAWKYPFLPVIFFQTIEPWILFILPYIYCWNVRPDPGENRRKKRGQNPKLCALSSSDTFRVKKERLISSRRANIPIKLHIKATKHVPGQILFQTVQLSSNKWPITLTLQLCWGVFLVIPRSEIKLKNIYLFYI